MCTICVGHSDCPLQERLPIYQAKIEYIQQLIQKGTYELEAAFAIGALIVQYTYVLTRKIFEKRD